jgi:hypothetical protein
MKNLANRQLTENQRQEIIDLAGGESGEYTFRSLKYRLIEMLEVVKENCNKPAYSSKDAMYQSFSDRQDNFKRTGKF